MGEKEGDVRDRINRGRKETLSNEKKEGGREGGRRRRKEPWKGGKGEGREGGRERTGPLTSREELDDHVEAGFLPVLAPVDEVEHHHRLQEGEDGKDGVRNGEPPRTT